MTFVGIAIKCVYICIFWGLYIDQKVYNDNLILVTFQDLKLPAETTNGTWICLFKT